MTKKKSKKLSFAARVLRFLNDDDDRLTNLMNEEPEPQAGRPDAKTEIWGRSVDRVADREVSFFTKIYPVMAGILCLCIIAVLLLTATELPRYGKQENPTLNEVTDRYLNDGMRETGAVNLIAGIILDYRAFDTLGESHVLFTAATAVLILLWDARREKQDLLENRYYDLREDDIFRHTLKILTPAVLLFGFYIVANGHLSPGGGFSGGAILGAGLILHALGYGFEETEKLVNRKSYSTVVVLSLCFYSLSKCYSFFTGANGLHSFISSGIPGKILSAGLILPLNIAVGCVVACTMYGFFSLFKRGRI